MTPDGAVRHTIPVTDTPDAVTAAVAALIEHDATCDWCAVNLGVPGAARCTERDELFAARRRALTGRAGATEEAADVR